MGAFADLAVSTVLTEDEREFVVELTQQLYGLVDVRFFISNKPRWDVCQSERTRYTWAPR